MSCGNAASGRENVARKIQRCPWCDTKLITNGRLGSRAAKRHVARTPACPVHRLPGSTLVFGPSRSRNFGLMDAPALADPGWSRVTAKSRLRTCRGLADRMPPALAAKLLTFGQAL